MLIGLLVFAEDIACLIPLVVNCPTPFYIDRVLKLHSKIEEQALWCNKLSSCWDAHIT